MVYNLAYAYSHTLQISSSDKSVATNSFLVGKSTPYTFGNRTGGEALARYTCRAQLFVIMMVVVTNEIIFQYCMSAFTRLLNTSSRYIRECFQ